MVVREVLSNGITVLVDSDSRWRSVSLAFYLVSGLSDEKPEEVGITHLLEHLLFRRTKHKTNRDIARAIDELGADINAFTDHSAMCIHGAIPKENLQQLFCLCTELLLENQFSDEDFELEYEVIRQEILESEDDPADMAFQTFNRGFWANSMLRFPVFGELSILQNLSPLAAKKRLARILQGQRLIVAAVGDVSLAEVVDCVSANFAHLPTGARPELVLGEPVSGSKVVTRPGEQVHFILGCPWAPVRNAQYVAGQVLANILGAGMASRLFQLLREQNGLVYDTGAEVDAFQSQAVLQIYAAVERPNLNQVLELVLLELRKLSTHFMLEEEIERSKKMITAQIEMECDSIGLRLWRAIDTELLYGRYLSAAESAGRVRALTTEAMREMVSTWMSTPRYYLSVVGDLSESSLPIDVLSVCK